MRLSFFYYNKFNAIRSGEAKEQNMYSKIYSGMSVGISGMLIKVEADISPGLPSLNMVGYLSSSVKEAGDRVRTAIRNTGFSIPVKRITINLSPADLRKEGSLYDLPIAIAILLAMQVIPVKINLKKSMIIGELGLNGCVLPVTGVLPIVDYAKKSGFDMIFVPKENADEAGLVKGISIVSVSSLGEILTMIDGERKIEIYQRAYEEKIQRTSKNEKFDFADIIGQKEMKEAVVIAAAGFHNILLTGEAGAGKSMIAKCIPGILPNLNYNEKLTLTKIYSVAGMFKNKCYLPDERPFREPHHSSTVNALIGGGNIPVPGEISLSHGGILFLDEFPEFNRNVIEALRQPMEDGEVMLSRVRASYTFPAQFMLVAASNLCPCGYYPDEARCRCSEKEIIDYQNRISKPVLDRIDIRTYVKRLSGTELFSGENTISSEKAGNIVLAARERQAFRFKEENFKYNSAIPQKKIDKYIKITENEKNFLMNEFESEKLSARGYFRLLKLALTVADVNMHETITEEDLNKAMFLRRDIDLRCSSLYE